MNGFAVGSFFTMVCRNKATNELAKMKAVYTPLEDALRYRWNNLSKRQTKELNPAALFSLLGLLLVRYVLLAYRV